MPKLTTGGTSPTWEDLGGLPQTTMAPTNDSAKLKDPSGGLKKVSDAVTNRKGKTLKQGDEVEVTDEQEIVAEEPATEEVVAEEETVEEETVETVEYDMEDDLNALVEGLELSEENQNKAKTIFGCYQLKSFLTQFVQKSKKSTTLNWMVTYKKLRKIYKNV